MACSLLWQLRRVDPTAAWRGRSITKARSNHPNHRFDLTAFGDPSKGDNGPQRNNALLAANTARFSELTKYGGHNQVLKYDGIINPNWLLEGSVARSFNQVVETPSVNEHQFTDTTVTPNVLSGGIGFYDQDQHGRNWQFQLKSTNIFYGAGNHQVR